MSNLEIIDRLTRMLDDAQDIIRAQEILLEQHGIRTELGDLERERADLLKRIEETC